jgi:hypothetical protein
MVQTDMIDLTDPFCLHEDNPGPYNIAAALPPCYSLAGGLAP